MQWVMDRVSTAHLRWAYPWKTLLQSGVVVAGGSDAPIETCCPFTGMHDAILRQSRDDEEDIFRPEERVDFAEALWMYTIGAAYAANSEHFLGQVYHEYTHVWYVLNCVVTLL
jgi:predicted amidohydrolase YtcJ